MLSKKEIESLEKGTYTNNQLANMFPKHGKKSREVSVPVDKNGNIVSSFLKEEIDNVITMRLNRQMYRRR